MPHAPLRAPFLSFPKHTHTTNKAPPSLHHQVRVLVLGAGPTGLGAATRLHQHGEADWLLLEAVSGCVCVCVCVKEREREAHTQAKRPTPPFPPLPFHQASTPGGLASTTTTPAGFLFDMGGHVVHSHYAYFDGLIDAAVPAWNTLRRSAFVRARGVWVPYPFQHNLGALPPDDAAACLAGAVAAARAAGGGGVEPVPRTFDEWIVKTMGESVASLFMRPYNAKVWGCPPRDLGVGWLGDRVAGLDLSKAAESVARGGSASGNKSSPSTPSSSTSWGPNSVFRFPATGGTGAIWAGVAALLPEDKVRCGRRVVATDSASKTVTLADGHTVAYASLITTLPLDVTLDMVGAPAELKEGLTHSSTHAVGVGVRGPCPHPGASWFYFPEPDAPFYRATVFSNYAEANCPAVGGGVGDPVPRRWWCRGQRRPVPSTRPLLVPHV